MTKDLSETSGVDSARYVLERLRRSGRTGCRISHIDQLTGCIPVMTKSKKDGVPGTSTIQEAG